MATKKAPGKKKKVAPKKAAAKRKLAPKKAAPSKKKKAAPKKKPAPKRAAGSAKKLQRCSSGGGPVIGIPAELAGKWRGTLAPIGALVPPGWSWGTPGGPECDYDRACNKIEHRVAMPRGGFGSVPLGGGLALVFEGPLNTAWVPTAEGGIVVRNADDEIESVAELLELVAAVPAAKWKPWPGQLTLRDGRIFFWDSAMEGADDAKAIPTNDTGLAIGTPGPGSYEILVAVDGEEHEYVKLTRI